MEDKELMVTIPLEKYDELKEIAFYAEMIGGKTTELIENSEPSWSKKYLTFDSEKVSELIKFISPKFYKRKLNELNGLEKKVEENE